ncbi:MAG TPA: UDP-galactopyranose mutase, partial [Fibrobacteraceae bacterium]|nr:UDP-galactopyranose mutase [Fibrobacteraceae bacterium]
QAKIEEQRSEMAGKEPANLEEQAISLVGRDIYEKLIQGYTEKQWGRKCKELPAFIIKRLPVRMSFDNNYFNDLYQGIPMGGYTQIFETLLQGIEIRLGVDYLADRNALDALAETTLFTGPIDAFYDNRFGVLEYRSVRFETELLDIPNFQGNAVVNYTEASVPYTRIIEHKHFEYGTQPQTVISREYSNEWVPGDDPYYPVNDEKNNALFSKYKALANVEPRHLFGGRLADYKYYDMHHVVKAALERAMMI